MPDVVIVNLIVHKDDEEFVDSRIMDSLLHGVRFWSFLETLKAKNDPQVSNIVRVSMYAPAFGIEGSTTLQEAWQVCLSATYGR